jgi:predicted dehydrogenase
MTSRHTKAVETQGNIDMDLSTRINRRAFASQAATGISLSLPMILSPTARKVLAAPAPSDRVNIGVIGVGDFGRRQHLGKLLLPNPRVQVAAVCDVDQFHREQAAIDVLTHSKRRVSLYKDFRNLLDRKDIDAVVIATPDHWHALIALAAIEAGKDVYCEKPLTWSIDEGKALVAAARRYGTVFQTGSQQRSDQYYFRQARDLVHRGAIGDLQRIVTHLGAGSSRGTMVAPQTPPANLDWNFWLGPAPYVDYTPERCHYSFRRFADYSGGRLTDHGAHQHDIVQWIIGADGSGPTHVEGTGTFEESGLYDTLWKFEVKFVYGAHGNVELTTTSDPSPHGGVIEIYGSRGHISVSRQRIRADDSSILQGPTGPEDYRSRLHESYVCHYTNWLDCIQSRQRPVCDVEIGHRGATISHLANIAARLQRPLRWDPVQEKFPDDDPANRLLGRAMRGMWSL